MDITPSFRVSVEAHKAPHKTLLTDERSSNAKAADSLLGDLVLLRNGDESFDEAPVGMLLWTMSPFASHSPEFEASGVFHSRSYFC